MKLPAILALCLSLSLAAGAEDITTTDGRTYTAATITKVEPDGIRILHESGTAKIPFAKLPPALQKKHGYNPAKAAEFKQAADAALAAQEAALDKELSAQALVDAKEKRSAAQTAAALKNATLCTFQIIQITSSNLLANKVTIEETVIATRSASIGMGGNVGTSYSTSVSRECYYVTGYPGAASLVEGKTIHGKFAEVGNHTYIDTDGASRTVAKYQFISAK